MRNKNIYKIGADLKITKHVLLPDKEIKGNDFFSLAKSANIGYYLITPILIGVVFGIFIDNRFNTKPTGVISGIIIGTIGTFYNLFSLIKSNASDKH